MINIKEHRGRQFKWVEGHQNDFWNGLQGWEPETFDMFDKFIKPGMVVADVGAWNGVLSIYASMLGAKVVAYEPDPIAWDELVANIKNNEANVIPYRRAVTDGSRNHEYLTTKSVWGDSMSSLMYDKADEGVEVMCVTLQSLPVFDFIKIDVEGAEIRILNNDGLRFLWTAKKPLYLAVHPNVYGEDGKEALKSRIIAADFTVEEISKDNWLILANPQ